MEKKTASAIMLTLLLTSMLTLAFNIQPVRAEPRTWTVDDDGPADFHMIQEAINTANSGDTIYVKAGTYYENVVVNKQVRLLGENRIGTIIDANATDIVLNIVANNVSVSGFTIKGSGSTCPDSGVLLQGVANCRIFGNRIIENLGDGIFLISCSNNVIFGNEVVGNDVDGISVSGSASNTISDNNVTGNGWSGIGLFGYSSDNNVTSNNVVNNPEGIAVVISARNEISENTIVSNSNWGISIYQSLNNSIFHNEFNNSLQVNSDGSPNMWDDGYPSGGNYWGDYAGVDLNHDGIGDIPYAIDANNHDNHPLMGMFSDFNATSEYQVQTICNSTISAFQFNGTAIIFKVAGEGGTTGFCRICIPTALMNSPYDVLVDGIEVPFTLLSCSNATQSYLYFAYAHSTHEIIIRTHIVPPSPLLVSISPVSALTYFGQSVTFTSTASGGTPPYGYQWYMNDSAVSGANSNSWTFALQPIGNYSVYLNVTDSFGSTAKSNEASVTVVPQLTASISPMSASVFVGQPVAFTSTVSGGYAPYSYQWYLNENPVSGATSNTWTFAPTAGGIYYVYFKVTDAKANTAQSDTARITVATVPVGGYSFPIQVHTKTEPVLPYIALIVALTAILTRLRPKTKRKR